MSVLATMRQSIQASRHGKVGSAWSTTLTTLGWPPPIISAIANVQAAHGPGFLGANYPNILAVLKTGPSHPAAGKVAGLLGKIAGSSDSSTSTCGEPGRPSGGGGAKEEVAATATAIDAQPWPSLAELDEAADLRTKLDRLDSTGAGWYAAPLIAAFSHAFTTRNIKRCRTAYIGVLERWLEKREVVRAFDDDRRERIEAERKKNMFRN